MNEAISGKILKTNSKSLAVNDIVPELIIDIHTHSNIVCLNFNNA